MEKPPTWMLVTMAVMAALGVLVFFQTRDPMAVILFILLPAMALTGVHVLNATLEALRGRGGVRVKCRACQALNLEDAKFCSQCGQAM